jgi:RNA polymerase sigma-70 factor (ECF subfamily)
MAERDREGDGRDEADLVERAQRDPAEFAALYEIYAQAIFRYCLFRLGTREQAEDATSQVFLKALSKLSSHRSGGTFRSWLFSIAHNTVTDIYRASRPVWPLSLVADLLDRRPGVEEEVLDRVERDELYLLLRHLPRGQRQVMELRLTGVTSAEIAEILGRSLGSVKIAQVRAVEKLRELLGVTIEPDVTELQEIPNAAPR